MFPEVDTHCCVICSKFTDLKTKQGNFLLLLRKDDGKKYSGENIENHILKYF